MRKRLMQTTEETEDSKRGELMETTCPECTAEFKPKSGLELGEIFGCTECGSRLEVMNLEPLKIQPAPTVEEDCGE